MVLFDLNLQYLRVIEKNLCHVVKKSTNFVNLQDRKLVCVKKTYMFCNKDKKVITV